eukprot:8826749-Heterocapsa_arctica.AAC.1
MPETTYMHNSELEGPDAFFQTELMKTCRGCRVSGPAGSGSGSPLSDRADQSSILSYNIQHYNTTYHNIL